MSFNSKANAKLLGFSKLEHLTEFANEKPELYAKCMAMHLRKEKEKMDEYKLILAGESFNPKLAANRWDLKKKTEVEKQREVFKLYNSQNQIQDAQRLLNEAAATDGSVNFDPINTFSETRSMFSLANLTQKTNPIVIGSSPVKSPSPKPTQKKRRIGTLPPWRVIDINEFEDETEEEEALLQEQVTITQLESKVEEKEMVILKQAVTLSEQTVKIADLEVEVDALTVDLENMNVKCNVLTRKNEGIVKKFNKLQTIHVETRDKYHILFAENATLSRKLAIIQ